MSVALKEQLVRDIAAQEPVKIAKAVYKMNLFSIGTMEGLKLQQIAANANKTKKDVIAEELLTLKEATLEILHDAMRSRD